MPSSQESHRSDGNAPTSSRRARLAGNKAPAKTGGSRRLDLVCLVIALVAHGPILSLGAWSWIVDLFAHHDDTDASDQEVEVPMELDLQDDPNKSDKKDAKVDEVAVVINSDEAIAAPNDAGAPEAPRDAGSVDAGPPDAGPLDAGPDASTPEKSDAGPPPKGPIQESPVESVHAPQNPSGNTNNVEIVLVGKVLRTHPIGLKLGSMLPSIKQWKGFFDNTGIDAVRDVDLMVIIGPEVMRHNDNVDVMMVFNTPPDRIHSAVDKILGRSSPVGGWLDDTAVPAAQGKADGSDRLFVLVPKQNELYVTPPPRQKKKNKNDPDWSAEDRDKAIREKIAKIGRLKAPSSDVSFAINLSVKEPGKLSNIPAPLVGKVQLIPDSFEKFVLRVYPADDGGARVRIELWDDTSEDAKNDLPDVQAKYEIAQIAAHSALELDLPNVKFDIDPSRDTRGRILFGEAEVSRAILEKMVAMGEEEIRKAKAGQH